MSELSTKPYYSHIAAHIGTGAKVLDIGCGGGSLLRYLMEAKQITAHGFEVNPKKVAEAMKSGLSVVQGDADRDLVHYPTHAYDVVILALSLQAMKDPKKVLEECLRIGKEVLVMIPNFGHLRNRIYIGLRGQMPVTSTLAYEWYETPNIHFCTIRDFIQLCKKIGASIDRRHYLTPAGNSYLFIGEGFLTANLFGEHGLFLLSK